MSHLKGHKLEYLFCFVLFFLQKGPGAESVDMATTNKLSICFSC